ncbi:MAG: DUF2079 domain-containing protein [bacterium]|nr:DUF2079 domain-containing protein [bacterium]
MRITAKQILWTLVIAYIVIFGAFVSLRHYNFQTQTWDLAAFVQTFWNTIHGRIMQNNLEQVPNHLGLHMSPWLLVLAPGYAAFPTPYFLLIIQTIFIGLGAWLVYLLAEKILNKQWLALIFGASYLLYPSLQWANTYDFHEITSFIPLMLAAFYFIEEEKWGWASFFLVLSASVKEDAILAVLFVGIYLLFRRKNVIARPKDVAILPYFKKNKIRIFGFAVVILALIYFIVAVKILMPAFGGGVLRFDRYANLGGTPSEIIQNVSAHPNLLIETVFTWQKLFYFLLLFLPVAFLPFFSWRTLLLLIPGLAENLLTNYTFQFNSMYHYDAILIPAIFFGAIHGFKFIQEKWPRDNGAQPARINWVKWILLGLAVFSFLTRSPIGLFSFPTAYFKPNAQWNAYRNMVALVPDDISVAANTNLVPHLAHREFVYALGREPFMVDMVLIDSADPFGFDTAADFQAYFDKYQKSGLYQAQIFEDRYIVLVNTSKMKLVPK